MDGQPIARLIGVLYGNGRPVTALRDADLSEISKEIPRRLLAGGAQVAAGVVAAMLLATSVLIGVSLAHAPQTGGLSAALTELNSSSLDTRLSGIDALKKIMYASPSDQPAVMRALSAFIRRRSPASHSDGPVTTDAQAALDVLGSRNISHDDGVIIDLVHANLTSANLVGIDLSKADLSNADLTAADLSNADLSDADLSYAHLGGASVTDTNFAGANLAGASFCGTPRCSRFTPNQPAEV